MATFTVADKNNSPETPSPTISRPALVMLIIGTIVVSLLLFSQTSLNLSFISPDSPSGTLVLIGLSALIFLLFVALLFVLLRNVLKLFAERKLRVLGSAFRTRMVIGGLILSFLPVIFMFFFAYVLMNRSIDKWFSRPVEELREDSAQVAGLLSSYAAANARAEAITLSGGRTAQKSLTTGDFSEMNGVLQRQQANLQGGFSLVIKGDKELASYGLPLPWNQLSTSLSAPLERYLFNNKLSNTTALGPTSSAFPFQVKSVQYLVGVADLAPDTHVIVALPLPAALSQTLSRIESNQRRYFELSTQRRQVRRFYMQLLLLITVLVLFAATWLAIFMARLVTRPVAALAEATDEISKGNLEYRVHVSAADELGELIKSFNTMASQLESNRREIEQSRRELASTNVALSDANKDIEQRRSEIETILENIPTGVLSLDSTRRVSHSNQAFEAMFRKVDDQPDATLRNIFDASVALDLEHLLRRADRMGTASREMQIKGHSGELNIEVTVASLQHQKQHLGYVIVFEDLSDLLKAQKQVAWREVARRVAHEIKNPLTPIALSAERIRRHLDRNPPGIPPDSSSLAVIHGCAETISGAVETMRTLVDEFATLARFPTAQPQPTSINHIVESALAMFHGRLDGINLRTELASNLPSVLADPDSIKRVVANLVDNAAEATQDSMLREIHIATALVADDSREMIEISVSDSGHGVTSDLREKLFLPYFSTKERGTGLGLAIVSRIIEEHHGSVRVEENSPVGARFVVELPVATSATNGAGGGNNS